jgi:hypothetical protein
MHRMANRMAAAAAVCVAVVQASAVALTAGAELAADRTAQPQPNPGNWDTQRSKPRSADTGWQPFHSPVHS